MKKALEKKSVDELKVDLIEQKKNLMSLRFMQALNQLKDTSKLRETKKHIARILTVISSIQKENNNA